MNNLGFSWGGKKIKLSDPLKETGIYFNEGLFPFYAKNSFVETGGVFAYSDLVCNEGVTLTHLELKEYLNALPVPVLCKFQEGNYIVAKGLLVKVDGENLIPWFFASNADSIEKVDFYVRAEALRENGVRIILLDYISEHTGRTFVETDIAEYFGSRIELPKFGTIDERKAFLDNLIKDALQP